jgi:CubicO group peptidase (beta-lactamase class C family)
MAALAALPAAAAPPRLMPSGERRQPMLSERRKSELRARIQVLLAQSTVPSLSLAWIEGDEVAWAEAFGVADETTGQEATTDTIYQAASLTKPTFAWVVLRLVEAGVLHLNTPLLQYLPAVRVSRDSRVEAITAAMVLCHSSGLPLSHTTDWPMRLDAPPGALFSYSGAGYLYLQQVIEHLAGQPLASLYRRHVQEPFRLPQESFSYTWREDYGRTRPIAIGYDWDGSPVRLVSRPTSADAAGSLHTTPTQFARFMMAAMFDDRHTEMRQQMLRPHIPLADGLHWGYGWGVQTGAARQPERFWHFGDSRGYCSFAVGDVASRTGLVLFTNSRHGMRLCGEIYHAFYDRNDPIFPWIYGSFYKGDLREWP